MVFSDDLCEQVFCATVDESQVNMKIANFFPEKIVQTIQTVLFNKRQSIEFKYVVCC